MMTSESFINQLEQVKDVRISCTAHDDALRTLSSDIGLPSAHLKLLSIANGISTYGGYFRLFGCNSSVTSDIFNWNASETWLFAWEKSLDEYWFFGETAWGDQYAYRKDELKTSLVPKVFLLENLTMSPRAISNDFESFLRNEFLRNATKPYDSHLIAARRRLGDLENFEHICYLPSPLVSGVDDINSISKMNAVSSMIINGDLCRQLSKEFQDRPIDRLEPYQDANGCMRMRVIWEKTTH